MQSAAITKTYTPKQWKREYDQVILSLNNADDKQKQEIILKKRQLESIGKHYDYFNDPRKLVETLIADTQRLLVSYDKTNLMNQNNELRFFMIKMNELLTGMQAHIDSCVLKTNEKMMNKKLFAKPALYRKQINKYCQEQYDKLCFQLAHYAAELRYQDERFHEKLILLLNQYAISEPIVIPKTDFSLVKDDLDWLQTKEKAAYKEALKSLLDTLQALPEPMKAVKRDGFELIHKIEANRLASEAPSRFFKKQPFDYKRQTLNITKTNALLKNPSNTKLQNEYKELIESNRHHNDANINFGMRMLLGGITLLVVMLAIVSIVPIPVAVAGAIALDIAIGTTFTAVGSGFLIKAKATTTENCMSKLFNTAMKTPHDTKIAVTIDTKPDQPATLPNATKAA